MGNHKLRISDMMPNSWFYKLRDMSMTRNHNPSHSLKKNLTPIATSQDILPHTKFYNSPTNPKFSDTHFPDPPRKSPKTGTKRKSIHKSKTVTSSVSANCSCRATIKSVWTKPDHPIPLSQDSENSSVSEFEKSFSRKVEKVEGSDPISEPEVFRPIPTNPVKFKGSYTESVEKRRDSSEFEESEACGSLSTKIVKESETGELQANFRRNMNLKSFSRKVGKLESYDKNSETDIFPPIPKTPVKSRDPNTKSGEQRRISLSIQTVKEAKTGVKVGANFRASTNEKSFSRKVENLESFDKISETDTFPPILKNPAKSGDSNTKPGEQRSASLSIKTVKEAKTGMKVGANFPGKLSEKVGRRRFSESFAIVKSSFDPQRDFKESMVEMIAENKIRASKDLEELLACYLSLNSDEYHHVIVKAFEQIWIDLRL